MTSSSSRSAGPIPDGRGSVRWLFPLFLAVVTFIAYIPAWHGGFVWNDDEFILHNPNISFLDGLYRIWFKTSVQYYPLTYSTFWIEYHFWGLDPLGYHLVNIGFHVLDAILLWRVLLRLSVPGAWLASAIFALHPVNVESVAWIVERKNTLSCFFFLCSILAALKFWLPIETRRSRGHETQIKSGSSGTSGMSVQSETPDVVSYEEKAGRSRGDETLTNRSRGNGGVVETVRDSLRRLLRGMKGRRSRGDETQIKSGSSGTCGMSVQSETPDVVSYEEKAGRSRGDETQIKSQSSGRTRVQSGTPGVVSRAALNNWKYYWLAFALFICALFSKTTTIPLPAVILLLVWWKRGRLTWRDIYPCIPFVVAGVAVGAITHHFEHDLGAYGKEFQFSFVDRLLLAAGNFWFYLGKLVWPHPLMFVYPRWNIRPSSPLAWLALLAFIPALAILWFARKIWGRTVFVAFAYFAGLLFLMLGFFNIFFFLYSFVSDHFVYLACMGPFALFAAGLTLAFRRSRGDEILTKSESPESSGPAVQSETPDVVSHKENERRSRGDETLIKSGSPESPGPVVESETPDVISHKENERRSRGNETLIKSGSPESPGPAVQSETPDVVSHKENERRSRGNETLAKSGSPESPGPVVQSETPDVISYKENERRSRGDETLTKSGPPESPGSGTSHTVSYGYPVICACILGVLATLTWKQSHIYSSDVALWRDTIAKNPRAFLAYNNLGDILLHTGELDAAIGQFEKSVAIHPDPGIYHNLGNALMSKGQPAEALADFRRELQLAPGSSAAYADLGNYCLQAGRPSEAINELKKALAISPKDSGICYDLGNAYVQDRQLDEAIQYWQKAVELSPGFAPAHNNLGNAYHMKGQIAQAIENWKDAIIAQPNSISAQVNLAWVWATSPDLALRDGPNALALARRADQLTGGANPMVLRVLSAALAENGQFSDAIAAAEQALERCRGNAPLTAAIQAQLRCYENNQPYRDQTLAERGKR